PVHPYTKGLLAAIPRIGRRMGRLAAIPGRLPDLRNPPSGCRFHTRCPIAIDRCSQEEPEFREVRPGHFVACLLAE
ncbi:MAG: oligopeptide/dipeptide ABC transporter ATP-binding protein, partial [Anaerolineales bacterium]